VSSWLLTGDHKRIAILYLLSILAYFILAAAAAALMRWELLTPQGDVVSSETYKQTVHASRSIDGVVLSHSIDSNRPGNFVLPIMLGARDVAFPKLNLLSWYLFMIGGALAMGAIIFGGVDTGWTFYTPYSSAFSNTHVVTMATGIAIAGFGSILTGLNFIVTIHKLRAPD
jgi:cytochrome c oxidase subunit 1